jgi:hypothetical protein
MAQGNIRKKTYTNNFVIISNDIARDNKLSWDEKGMILCLMSHSEDWKLYKSTLHNFAQNGKDSTRTTFDNLVKKGYIRSVRVVESANKFLGWEHTFDVNRFSEEGSDVGITDVGNPHIGNPHTKNTNIQENKEKENKDLSLDFLQTKTESKKRPVFVIPEFSAVELYAKENGFDPTFAKLFFDYYDRCGWIDAEGKKVKSWKNKMQSWISREQNDRYRLDAKSGSVKRGATGVFYDTDRKVFWKQWSKDGQRYECYEHGEFKTDDNINKIPYNG